MLRCRSCCMRPECRLHIGLCIYAGLQASVFGIHTRPQLCNTSHLALTSGSDGMYACVPHTHDLEALTAVPCRAGSGCLWCLRPHLLCVASCTQAASGPCAPARVWLDAMSSVARRMACCCPQVGSCTVRVHVTVHHASPSPAGSTCYRSCGYTVGGVYHTKGGVVAHGARGGGVTFARSGDHGWPLARSWSGMPLVNSQSHDTVAAIAALLCSKQAPSTVQLSGGYCAALSLRAAVVPALLMQAARDDQGRCLKRNLLLKIVGSLINYDTEMTQQPLLPAFRCCHLSRCTSPPSGFSPSKRSQHRHAHSPVSH